MDLVGRALAIPASIRALQWIDGYALLLAYVYSNRRKLRKPAMSRELIRHISAVGLDAFGTIAVLAAISGTLVITQISAVTGGENEAGMRLLIWVLLKELAPLLTALIVVSRSSAAMASELALMRLSGELVSLSRLGIRPEDYLLLPRVAGVAIAMVALAFCFQVIAMFSGLVANGILTYDIAQQVSQLLTLARPSELLLALLKSGIFGLVIGVIACYHGAVARSDPADVPRSGTRAVANTLLVVFALDIGVAIAAVFIH